MADGRGAQQTRRPGASDAEESAREALGRARTHLRAALAEALEAARALLDAASLAANGRPADAHPALARVSASIDALAAQLAGDGAALSPPIVEAILDALDVEIRRWEERSQSDPEARPVLRAFMGMREILWEFGLRRDGAAPPEPASRGEALRKRRAAPAEGAPPRRARVRRVDVQGQ